MNLTATQVAQAEHVREYSFADVMAADKMVKEFVETLVKMKSWEHNTAFAGVTLTYPEMELLRTLKEDAALKLHGYRMRIKRLTTQQKTQNEHERHIRLDADLHREESFSPQSQARRH